MDDNTYYQRLLNFLDYHLDEEGEQFKNEFGYWDDVNSIDGEQELEALQKIASSPGILFLDYYVRSNTISAVTINDKNLRASGGNVIRDFIELYFDHLDSKGNKDIEGYIRLNVNLHVEEMFTDVYSEFDVKSGDITPEQEDSLASIKNRLVELIYEQVKQNL